MTEQALPQALPHVFCVKAKHATREGFFLLRWSTGETAADGAIVHVLKPMNHHQRFYNITTVTSNYTLNKHITRKGRGNVTRPMHWHFTENVLRDPDGMRIPVLRVTSRTVLPAMKLTSFIPIVTNEPVQPAQPAQPTPVIQPKKYTITSIPQNAIRALLTNAVMNEEICPITTTGIDVSNGAVTSCFHYFEKTAINTWLRMPNSKDECPLCKTPCNSYTLDS